MTKKIANIVETYFNTAICVLVVSYILWLTLQPNNVRMTVTDVNLTLGAEILLCYTMLTCIIQKFQKQQHNTCLNIGWSDAFVLLWLVYFCSRVWFWNENPCATDALKGVMVFMVYFALRLFFSFYHLADKILILALLLFGSYEALLGISQLINGSSNHALFLITGTFYNPGPYSAYLVLGTVVLLSMLHSETKGMYLFEFKKVKTIYLYYALLLLFVIVLPATWSRSAFVALAVICLWIYRDKYFRYRYLLWGSILIVVIGLYFLKKGSADGRMFIWLSSLTAWKHSPLIGTGIGSFFHAEAEGSSELFVNNGYMTLFDSADITNFMCNDSLRLLLEQGLVGMLLCALAIITMLVKLHRNSKSLCYGIVALLIFSITSYPFELLPYKLIVVLIAAWGNSQPKIEARDNAIQRVIHKPLFSLGRVYCLALSGILILGGVFLKTEMEKRIEAANSYHLISNIQQEAFINDYYELLPLESDHSLFLFDFGKLLRLLGRYSDSNAILQKGTLVSNDPMFYVLMGNNYKDMKHYDMAEQAYQKAFSVMPNRLYPLYQLMMLYHDSGNIKKAKEMAKRVVKMKPKIESPATKDMKKKAEEILRNK